MNRRSFFTSIAKGAVVAAFAKWQAPAVLRFGSMYGRTIVLDRQIDVIDNAVISECHFIVRNGGGLRIVGKNVMIMNCTFFVKPAHTEQIG